MTNLKKYQPAAKEFIAAHKDQIAALAVTLAENAIAAETGVPPAVMEGFIKPMATQMVSSVIDKATAKAALPSAKAKSEGKAEIPSALTAAVDMHIASEGTSGLPTALKEAVVAHIQNEVEKATQVIVDTQGQPPINLLSATKVASASASRRLQMPQPPPPPQIPALVAAAQNPTSRVLSANLTNLQAPAAAPVKTVSASKKSAAVSITKPPQQSPFQPVQPQITSVPRQSAAQVVPVNPTSAALSSNLAATLPAPPQPTPFILPAATQVVATGGGRHGKQTDRAKAHVRNIKRWRKAAFELRRVSEFFIDRNVEEVKAYLKRHRAALFSILDGLEYFSNPRKESKNRLTEEMFLENDPNYYLKGIRDIVA